MRALPSSDLDAPLSRPPELRRIGVVVDRDRPNGRRRNVQRVGLYAIDNELRTLRAHAGGLKEKRRNRQRIAVEDGQFVQRRRVELDIVAVLFHGGCDVGLIADGDLLLHLGELEADSQRARRCRSDFHRFRYSLETWGRDVHNVLSRLQALELEVTILIRRRLQLFRPGQASQLNIHAGDRSPGGIHQRSFQDDLALSVGEGQR